MDNETKDTVAISEPTLEEVPQGVLPSSKKRAAPRRKPKLFSLAKTPTGPRKATDPVQVGVQRTYSLFDLGFFLGRRPDSEPCQCCTGPTCVNRIPTIKEEPEDSDGDADLRTEGVHSIWLPDRDKQSKPRQRCNQCGLDQAGCHCYVFDEHPDPEIGIFCAACHFSLGSWDHAMRCLCYCDDIAERITAHIHEQLDYDGPDKCHYCTRSRASYEPTLVRPRKAKAPPKGQTIEIHEVVSHVPQTEQSEEPAHQGSDDDQDQGQVPRQSPGLSDSDGEPQRRDSPRTHSDPAEQADLHERSKLLRLRVRETWQLLSGQESLRDLQLSSQVGHDTLGSWCDPGSLQPISQDTGGSQKEEDIGWWKPYAVESSKSSRRYTLWVLPSLPGHSRPCILYAEQDQDRELLLHVCTPTEERLEATLARPVEIQGNGPIYIADHRVVELQYQIDSTLSTATAVRKWTKTVLQDRDGRIAQELLDDIRRSGRRRLLRHVSERLLRFDLDGRVPRPEENPRPQQVASRKRPHVEEEGNPVPEGGQPGLHLSVELLAEGSLCQSTIERPQQARHTGEQVARDTTLEAPGHKRLRRSARLARLITDEKLSDSGRGSKSL